MKFVVLVLIAFFVLPGGQAEARARHHHHRHHAVGSVDANGNNARELIGGRPDGCPSRYCGCALARFLGIVDEQLNLAANWLKFPHVAPQPGAVAAKHGHVMQLVKHVEGNRWVVRSYNGGRHLSWIYVRDISRYTTVMPPNV